MLRSDGSRSWTQRCDRSSEDVSNEKVSHGDWWTVFFIFRSHIRMLQLLFTEEVTGWWSRDTVCTSSTHLCSLIYNRDASLLSYLPKTLGFAVGLEFRDNTLLLNSSNSTQFSDGMRTLPYKPITSISYILLLLTGIFAYLGFMILITNLACLTWRDAFHTIRGSSQRPSSTRRCCQGVTCISGTDQNNPTLINAKLSPITGLTLFCFGLVPSPHRGTFPNLHSTTLSRNSLPSHCCWRTR